MASEEASTLQSADGKFLAAEQNGDCKWNRDEPKGWEHWTVETVVIGASTSSPEQKVAFKCTHGGYLTVPPNPKQGSSAPRGISHSLTRAREGERGREREREGEREREERERGRERGPRTHHAPRPAHRRRSPLEHPL